MEDIKISETPCKFFWFISLILWAEPTILKFFFSKHEMGIICLLKEGKYSPSKLYLMAILKSLEI